MANVIFTTSFYCKFCEKDIPLCVYGDRSSSFPESKKKEEEASEWGEHFHWCDHHRRCAICGELVISGNQDNPKGLNLMVNDGKIQIHREYLLQTFDRAHKGELLVVHNECLEKYV